MESTQIRILADTGPESDTKELLDATRQLRQMLLAQRVEGVALEEREAAPDGSKSADMIALGALVVALAPPMIEAVVATVNAWAERRSGRSAKVVIEGSALEVTGITAEQTKEIIDEFWRRTATEDPEGATDGDA